MWLFFYRFYLPERQKSSRGELEENNDQKTVPLASIALRRLTRPPSPEDTRTSGDMASSGPSGGATRTLRPPPTRLCVITQVKDQTPPHHQPWPSRDRTLLQLRRRRVRARAHTLHALQWRVYSAVEHEGVRVCVRVCLLARNEVRHTGEPPSPPPPVLLPLKWGGLR